MTTVAEASLAKSQLGADLAAGVNLLGLDQTVYFTKYVKLVLPLDGFVFWVKADLLSPAALFNASALNAAQLNANLTPVTPAPVVAVKGSFHYSSATNQDEDAIYSNNVVTFTALSEIQAFNEIGPQVIFIATFDKIRFAFNNRGGLFKLADLYHYSGSAIYSTMQSQIIDHPAQFNARQLVVSNSLPIWLSMRNYSPPYPGFGNAIDLYPSFAVPDNLPPPYAAIHIPPAATLPLQAFASLGPSLSHAQLVQDRVQITTYGLNNDAALSFVDFVCQFSNDLDTLGIMNMPVFRDEKKTQSELGILAMKKTIEFEVSYYQSAARSAARQMISSALVSYLPTDLDYVVIPGPPSEFSYEFTNEFS